MMHRESQLCAVCDVVAVYGFMRWESYQTSLGVTVYHFCEEILVNMIMNMIIGMKILNHALHITVNADGII